MSIQHWLVSASVATFTLLPFQPTLAITTSKQVATFPDGTETRLVMHHQRLFSFTEMPDGTIQASVANTAGDAWEDIPSDQASVSDLLADTSQIDQFAVFKGRVFMATRNSSDEVEVWNMCLRCRPAAWEQSGDTSFGDSANTKILDLFRSNGTLLALTENAAGDSLFSTEDGETWTQVGVAGLGLSITDAVGLSGRIAESNDHVYLATAAGAIYSASQDDLTTWTLATTLDGTITALQGVYAAVVTSDGVAKVYETSDGTTYTQVGEDGLGNANTTEVDRFFRVGDQHFAVTKNATNGAEIRRWSEAGSEWVLVTEAGFGDANNSSIRSLLVYHGHHYAAVNNSVDGPSIYKLSHVDED